LSRWLDNYALIGQLREHDTTELVCCVFGISLSSYYERRYRHKAIDAQRLTLRAKVNALFTRIRSSAGSRTLVAIMAEQGIKIVRFKVSRLMSEAGLVCKQPGQHNYKKATLERPDIPNELNRQFNVM
jgi:putative transposase